MEGRLSDEQLLEKVQCWIMENSDNYEDYFTLSCDSVKDGKIQLIVGETCLHLIITNGVGENLVSLSDSVSIGTQLLSKSQNSQIQQLVSEFNAPEYMRSSSLEETLAGILDRYMQLKMQEGADHGDEDQQMNDESEDDWTALADGDPDEDDYVELTKKQVREEEKINSMKYGSNSIFNYDVINLKSIKLFEQTKFYEECLDAQKYLQQNEHLVKGWLNIVVVKEILNLRLEIDLNYLDLTPSNILLFGWNSQEPLTLVFTGNESKLLNSDILPYQLDFKNIWNRGMLEFSSHNANKIDSYGCKVYTRQLVQKYIEKEFQGAGQNEEEDKQGAQGVPSKSSFSSKLLGMFKGGEKVDDEQLAQLVEMGFDVKIAKEALKAAKNDLCKALDFIREGQLQGVASEIEQPQVKMNHILPPTNNKVIQLLLYISSALETSTRNCFVCLEPLEAESIKLRTCTKDYCEYSFEESFGGSVFPEMMLQTNEAHFDLSIAAKALFSTRGTTVFEPFPTFFLKHNEIRSKRGYLDAIKQVKELGKDIKEAKKIDEKNKDMEAMIKIFMKMPRPQDLLKDALDEESLKGNLKRIFGEQTTDHHKAYQLLAYIIATNRTSVRLLKDDERIEVQPKDYFQQYILTSSDPKKERIFQAKKKKHGSFYCWHGSSMENWFSILRNGLRNLSNSHMMTAGAAYGQGIYASTNYSTSLGYTQRYTAGPKAWASSSLKNSYIMGVVEVINVPEYKKDPQGNICVIPNEDDIVLRYMFVFGHEMPFGQNVTQLITTNMNFENHYTNYIKKLQERQNQERKQRIEASYKKYLERKQKEEQYRANLQGRIREREEKELDEAVDKDFEKMMNKFQQKGSAMSSKRIKNDYKGLQFSADFKDIVKIDFFKENMYVWKVVFDIMKYEISPDLKADFVQLGKKVGRSPYIEYEVLFSDDYPISPPFFRVVFPRFKYQTGHVTVGGSICMQSLTPSGWTSARSIESYFVEILSLLNEGGARLDLNNLNSYSLYEAKEAFQRVAKQHGWMK